VGTPVLNARTSRAEFGFNASSLVERCTAAEQRKFWSFGQGDESTGLRLFVCGRNLTSGEKLDRKYMFSCRR
jgi:hypothetical protein